MELKDTVDLMLSADYKERFYGEYCQIMVRRNKLGNLIHKYYKEELDFVPDTPIKLLEAQYNLMGAYLDMLLVRADIEGVVISFTAG